MSMSNVYVVIEKGMAYQSVLRKKTHGIKKVRVPFSIPKCLHFFCIC